MMKALNPETRAHKKGGIDPFWRNLFEKLNTLSQLQLIVCPDSDTHNNESRVSTYYKPLKRMYELLSHGTTFYDHQTIEQFQVIEHLRNMIVGKPDAASQLTAHNLVYGNLNQWTDRLLITYEIPVKDEALEEMRRSRDELAEKITIVFGRWQTEKDASFNDWFEEEARAFGTTVLLVYEDYLKSYTELMAGKRPPTEKDVFPPAAVNLVQLIKTELRAAGVREEYLHRVTVGFLNSPTLKEIPAIKVSSMLWAAIARKAAAGKKEPPTRGTGNDINTISSLLPYCDAMFVDKECWTYLNEQPLARELNAIGRVFSLANKEQFLDYLDDVKNSASPEHLRLINEIYGEPKPYTTLYKREEE
jgi:hypothetical protein